MEWRVRAGEQNLQHADGGLGGGERGSLSFSHSPTPSLSNWRGSIGVQQPVITSQSEVSNRGFSSGC